MMHTFLAKYLDALVTEQANEQTTNQTDTAKGIKVQLPNNVVSLVLPQTGRHIEELPYGDVLKRLLQELLSTNVIAKRHLDDVLYLIDIGKITLTASTDSKIVKYLNLLINTLSKIVGITTARILAYYASCEQKIYVLVDQAILDDLLSYVFRRVDRKTAYMFYLVLTHEFAHMHAAEQPRAFMSVFRNVLLRWYKAFTTVLDPLDLFLNAPAKIVDRLFNVFEKSYYRVVCRKESFDVNKLWVEGVVKAWFRPELLKIENGVVYLNVTEIPEGYYRLLVSSFYKMLKAAFIGDIDQVSDTFIRQVLTPAFETAYSAIRVPYPSTLYFQELLYPSEVAAIAVMYRQDLAEKTWDLLRLYH